MDKLPVKTSRSGTQSVDRIHLLITQEEMRKIAEEVLVKNGLTRAQDR